MVPVRGTAPEMHVVERQGLADQQELCVGQPEMERGRSP